MRFIMTTVVLLIFLFGFVIPTATAATQFSFPSFPPESKSDFLVLGDTAYDPSNLSYVINAGARKNDSRGSCGALVYSKMVHIQHGATGRAASFSATFSFRFTTHGQPWDNTSNLLDGSGIGFSFINNVPIATLLVASKMGQFTACRKSPTKTERSGPPPAFALYIDTDYNPSQLNEPSNNFIRVGKNLEDEYDVEAYTHNLCGNDTHCSYFTNGKIFTAWVDFTSSSEKLEIRMAAGTSPKPLQPLLLISGYKFPLSRGDEVYLSFWGSSDVNHLEDHEILSWSFFSTGISESKLRLLLHYLKTKAWIDVTTGGVLLGTLAASVILWAIYSYAKPTTSHSAFGFSAGPHVFSFNELRKATENFDERNLLGRGGSGVVYKGSLIGGGYLIAVKQINIFENNQAESLFHAEVASLGQIRHRNVVSLQGWCQEKGKLLLVYDYISNGTLNDWLYKKNRQQALSLKIRHSILTGVGTALEYLHKDCSRCILHRDIKSSNVLLDVDFNAYLGDFGLARLMDHHKLDKTTMAAGTFGYMAPELPYIGKATKESDVYSFGILMLEVVTGRRPLDLQAVEVEDTVLLFLVWQAYEGGSLRDIVDPKVFETSQPSCKLKELCDETSKVSPLPLDSLNLNDSSASKPIVHDVNIEVHAAMVVSLLQLGLFCCLPNPKARPSIVEVNRLLQQIRELENDSSKLTIPMPSLPTTKPPGLYHSLELSSGGISSAFFAPSPPTFV